MKFLEHRNPNSDVFVVPPQFGGVEDDNYFGSIGDATMRHVHSLSHAERQLWQELIHMRSGAIFRPEPSTEQIDPDPLNLTGKDLAEYFAEMKAKVSPETMKALKEAFDLEAERRAQSEDALDKAELIPYDQWEENPQMWSHLDLPTTPKDRMIYLGTSSQSFYDSFPEGHPDTNFINKIISTLDKDWEDTEEDKGYADCVAINLVAPANARDYTKKVLVKLCGYLPSTTMDPSDLIERALQAIDNYWREEYLLAASKKSKVDEMTNFLLDMKQQWAKRVAEGQNVCSDISKLGMALYSDKMLWRKMTRSAWKVYNDCKKEFAPKVLFKGIDLNRCSIDNLQRVLLLDRKEAERLWLSGPYKTIHAIYHAGFASKKAFITDELSGKIVDSMEYQYSKAIEEKKIDRLNNIRGKLNEWQASGKYGLTSSQWSLIWDYYQLLKMNFSRDINEKEKEGNKNVRRE